MIRFYYAASSSEDEENIPLAHLRTAQAESRERARKRKSEHARTWAAYLRTLQDCPSSEDEAQPSSRLPAAHPLRRITPPESAPAPKIDPLLISRVGLSTWRASERPQQPLSPTPGTSGEQRPGQPSSPVPGPSGLQQAALSTQERGEPLKSARKRPPPLTAEELRRELQVILPRILPQAGPPAAYSPAPWRPTIASSWSVRTLKISQARAQKGLYKGRDLAAENQSASGEQTAPLDLTPSKGKSAPKDAILRQLLTVTAAPEQVRSAPEHQAHIPTTPAAQAQAPPRRELSPPVLHIPEDQPLALAPPPLIEAPPMGERQAAPAGQRGRGRGRGRPRGRRPNAAQQQPRPRQHVLRQDHPLQLQLPIFFDLPLDVRHPLVARRACPSFMFNLMGVKINIFELEKARAAVSLMAARPMESVTQVQSAIYRAPPLPLAVGRGQPEDRLRVQYRVEVRVDLAQAMYLPAYRQLTSLEDWFAFVDRFENEILSLVKARSLRMPDQASSVDYDRFRHPNLARLFAEWPTRANPVPMTVGWVPMLGIVTNDMAPSLVGPAIIPTD